jgi:hypothetical protein
MFMETSPGCTSPDRRPATASAGALVEMLREPPATAVRDRTGNATSNPRRWPSPDGSEEQVRVLYRGTGKTAYRA